nr:MAG: hypothetical protein 1 [Locarnavirus sp.]
MMSTGQLTKEISGTTTNLRLKTDYYFTTIWSEAEKELSLDDKLFVSNKIKLSLQSLESHIPVEISEDTDYLIKLVENVLTLIRLLVKARDTEDYVLAITVFAQCRANKSLTNILLGQWQRIMSATLQSGSTEARFHKLKNILNQYDSVKKLPIFTKLYKFLLYCVGSSLFEKMGIRIDTKKFFHLEKAAIKREYHLGPDFIHCMLDTVVFVSELGYQCMITGSVDPIFHHETTYDKWMQEGELLKVQARYITNPEPHGFTVFDFISRLDDTLEKGKAMYKFVPKNDPARSLISRLMSDLEIVRSDCKTKRLAQQERKAPFAVLIHGGSSVAKSQFTKMLFYHYGKLFGLPIEDEFKYTRNSFDQYWTNFNTSQWCVQIDDCAYLHPNVATGCDPSLVEMLQVVNNVPYVPTQADLADKGKTPVQARFVIATTNTDHLNAETYFACPLAVQRRLPYVISIAPKPQYRRDNGPMIDPTRIPPSEPGSYPDLWLIAVKRVVPVDKTVRKSTHMGQTAELILEHEFEDVISFLQWFNGVARIAAGNQAQAMKCDEDMSKVKLCEHGVPTPKCDICYLSLQSGENTTVDTEWVRRVNEQFYVEPEQQTGYNHTMAGILMSISGYNIIVRILVWYYMFILHVIHTSPWGRFIVYYIYGRWAFWWVLMRLCHIPEVRSVAYQLLGHRMYRRIRTSEAVVFCSALAAAVTVVKTYKFLISTKEAISPSKEDHLFMCSGCETCKDWTEEERAEKAKSDNWRVSKETLERINKSHPQGASEERGVSPNAAGDKKENVWYKDTFECTPFDVSPSTLSRVHWTLDQAVKHVENNCAAFAIRARTETTIVERFGRIVCIGGHVYVANNHIFKWESFEISLVFQADSGGVNRNFTFLVTPSMYVRYPEKDLIFLEFNSIPPKKDIRDMFAKESYEGRFDGAYIQRSQRGELCILGAKAPLLRRQYAYKDCDNDICTDAWQVHVERPTVDGDCGSLLVTQSAMGPIILGIHCIGFEGTNRAYALAVNYELLASLQFVVFGDSSPTLQVGDYEKKLVPLSYKSEVRYIESGTAEVLGSLAGFRSNMKSRVSPTLLQPLAIEAGYEVKTGPPVMNSYEPWRKALLDMTRPVSHIDQTLLGHCVDTFGDEILAGLTSEDLAEIKVYDNKTAINGKPGLAYVDKLPRNTSAGFPFNKSKKFFLKALEPDEEYQNPVEVTPEILQEMDYIIVRYENSRIYCPIFTGCLKDEPTLLKKIMDSKTRVFCGAPMPWSIVVRKYYLSIIRLIQKNRLLFESGPGTIAQSKEWDDLYQYLTTWGTTRIIAGDYGKFDKRMPACVILGAFSILIRIMIRAGWAEKELLVARGIAEDIAFPTVDLHGTLYRFYGSNPSGHPLTVIINGIANSLYVRYCYALNSPHRSCTDFKQNVHLMTYGDDNIMGVNPDCSWFNHTVMRDTLAAIDIEYTMADKDAESVPFIDISEASFLKRSWRLEPELGLMVCPIEHDSIEKMLTMCVKSKSISEELQALAVLDTACREYFWYGKEVFQEKRTLFKSWITQLALEEYADRDLPSWESLIAEFKNNCELRA